MKSHWGDVFIFLAALLVAASCGPVPAAAQGKAPRALKVLAVESFLCDIAQNVAGSRYKVDTLLPSGMDPHSYEPTPADVVRVAECDVLIVNGGGLEEFLDRLLKNAGGNHKVIEASEGLASRTEREGENGERPEADHHHHEGDAHFWLSPVNVVKYVQNIRDALSRIDPEGGSVYAANAEAYIARLNELDRWIEEQVAQIPSEKRLLVTNHESFGYYADRYGFRIVGTIVPSVSTDAAPSARQLADLIGKIRQTGAKAIFLETGANPQLPRQVAKETGVRVAELYDHSITGPDGPAPDYISMLKYDTTTIVNALK
ncbi:MAG: metal ABC transporter substrate-binding protein [Syntrophobacteraceae bacterium]